MRQPARVASWWLWPGPPSAQSTANRPTIASPCLADPGTSRMEGTRPTATRPTIAGPCLPDPRTSQVREARAPPFHCDVSANCGLVQGDLAQIPDLSYCVWPFRNTAFLTGSAAQLGRERRAARVARYCVGDVAGERGDSSRCLRGDQPSGWKCGLGRLLSGRSGMGQTRTSGPTKSAG